MEKQVVVMAYEKATKNKHVYREEPSGPPVMSHLYLEKWATGDSPPARIRVTVETA